MNNMDLSWTQGSQITQIIAHFLDSLLGTNACFKCVVDDDHCILTNCACHFLGNLDICHPHGELVKTAVLRHHKQYRTSTKTVAAMICYWHQAMLQLVEEGVPIHDMVSLFHEGLDVLEETSISCAISTQDLLLKRVPTLPGNTVKRTTVPVKSFTFQPKNTPVIYFDVSQNNTVAVDSCPRDDLPKILSDAKDCLLGQRRSATILRYKHFNGGSNLGNNVERFPTLNGFELPLNPPIKRLSSETADAADKDATEDDIGWFFEDGKVPLSPSPPPDNVLTMGDLAALPVINNQDETHHLSSGTNTLRQCVKGVTGSPEVLKMPGFLDSEATLSDDEFDACFDGMNPTDSSLVDEFDSCFDDIVDCVDDDATKDLMTSSGVNSRSPKVEIPCHGTPTCAVNRNDRISEAKDGTLADRTNIHATTVEGDILEVTRHNLMLHSPGDAPSHSSASPEVTRCDSKDILDRRKDLYYPRPEDGVDPSRHRDSLPRTVTNETSISVCDVAERDEDAYLVSGPATKTGKSPVGWPNSYTCGTKILNKSRHFRTVDSAIAELASNEGLQKMNSSVEYHNRQLSDSCKDQSHVTIRRHGDNHEDFSSVRTQGSRDKCTVAASGSNNHHRGGAGSLTHLDSMLQSVAKLRIAAEAPGQRSLGSNSGYLNQSRHFKTLHTAVDEMNKSVQSTLGQITQNSDEFAIDTLTSASESNCLGHGENVVSNLSMIEDFELKAWKVPLLDDQLSLCNSQPEQQIWKERLKELVKGLCHGADDVTDPVLAVARTQLDEALRTGGERTCRLDLARIHSLAMSGPLSAMSHVVDGLVVEASTHQLTFIEGKPGQGWRALLINGDLCATYRHKGYQSKQKVVYVTNASDPVAKEDVWRQNALHAINSLEVNLLLVKGSVDGVFEDQLLGLGVATLSLVPYQVLLGVGEACQCNMSVYVDECSEGDIASHLTLAAWRPDWGHVSRGTAYVTVQCRETIHQTAVFCHPCESVAKIREEEFLHCVHRLAHSLKSGHVMSGRGHTEVNCIERLKNYTESTDIERGGGASSNIFRSAVYGAMASGLQRFVDTVRGKFTISECAHVDSDQSRSGIPLASFHGESLPILTSRSPHQSNFTVSKAKCLSTASDEDQGKFHSINQSEFAASEIYTPAQSETVVWTDQDPEPLDDWLSKVEAWRTAGHVVCQLLLSDKEITAGVSPREAHV